MSMCLSVYVSVHMCKSSVTCEKLTEKTNQCKDRNVKDTLILFKHKK
jgi:hypothetical protein